MNKKLVAISDRVYADEVIEFIDKSDKIPFTLYVRDRSGQMGKHEVSLKVSDNRIEPNWLGNPKYHIFDLGWKPR